MQPPEHFCTLFDRNYLARALVLYHSLERCHESFVLHALCMDEESRVLLERLSLAHMRPIAIERITRDDRELDAARANRSPKEFCWTCTPVVCRYVLHEQPTVETVTYLDADLCFWSSPAGLVGELGDASILLVPHRDPRHASDAGIYNVGWVTFRNDEHGRSALAWWRERCIEWCYDRLEADRFGDQKYLDDWPSRFEGVKVTVNPAIGLDPSSDDGHDVAASNAGEVLVDGTTLVFYHHAGLRIHPVTRWSLLLARLTGSYRVTGDLVWTVLGRPGPDVVALVWEPYIAMLSQAQGELAAAGAPPRTGLNRLSLRVAGRQVARQAIPGALMTAYRRIPPALRGRVARALSPS